MANSMATAGMVVLLCALRISAPAVGSATAWANQNHETKTESGEASIPFQLRSDFLVVVEVKVGSLAGRKFILDTGTTHSVLDRKVADALSLPREEAAVLNFDRRVKIGWSNVPELQIGPLRFRNLRMMVSPLAESSEYADGIDGIIGLDVLRFCQRVRINFDQRILTLSFGRANSRKDADETQAFLVELNVQGQQLRLILDSGLRDVVLFRNRIRNNAPHLKLGKKSWVGHEGWMEGRFTQLKGIRVGSKESEALAFVIPNAPQALPANIDGFLGIRALNSSLVELNFEVRSLRLVGPESATLALNESRTLNDTKAGIAPDGLKEEKTPRSDP